MKSTASAIVIVLRCLRTLPPAARARVLLHAILACAPDTLTDEAYMRLVHAAKEPP